MADRRALPRWARWTALGCGAAVLGAASYLVVDALPSEAATSGLRTATVATASVTQTISLSGSVERVDQVPAAFRTNGTVTSVEVAVGDEVEAGDVLATIGSADLERAVTVAQAELVAAQAALDAVESGSSTSTSTAASPAPSPAPTATPSPTTAARAPSSPSAPKVDTSGVHRAVADNDALVQAAITTCQPVIDAGTNPDPPSTPTPTPTPTPSDSPSPSTSPSPSPSPSPSQSPSTEPSNGGTATPSSSPAAGTPTATVEPAALATDDHAQPTAEQVSACVQALSAALTSAQHTASEMNRLSTALDAAARALQQQQSAAAVQGSTGQSPASGSGGTGSSAGAGGGSQSTASLAIEVLKTTQALAGAEQDLDAVVLRAPISGTVGQVDLVKGTTASTSSGVVVVGPGAAVVTVDLPLAQLGEVRVSQDVTVTPAGTTDELPGLVQSISVLPSSTTASTPTYPVRITVSDAPVTLATGSTATAAITLATATDVLTVPVSAVSGVSSGRGSVRVLAQGTVTATPVTVGAVGGGKVQVERGLSAGQVVVLADPATALPSSDVMNRFRRSTSGLGGLTQGGPGGGLGGPPGG